MRVEHEHLLQQVERGRGGVPRKVRLELVQFIVRAARLDGVARRAVLDRAQGLLGGSPQDGDNGF